MLCYSRMIEEENLELSMRYLKQSADSGYVFAMCKYAYYLENGIGVEKNETWYRL